MQVTLEKNIKRHPIHIHSPLLLKTLPKQGRDTSGARCKASARSHGCTILGGDLVGAEPVAAGSDPQHWGLGRRKERRHSHATHTSIKETKLQDHELIRTQNIAITSLQRHLP